VGGGGWFGIGGSDEPATGFSLYPEDLIEAVTSAEPAAKTVFLPLGHDRAAASRLRGQGWRTVAALAEADDPAALGCTHRLDGTEPVAL
jgi:ATP phosphoribosyltransferase regulatory subunit